MNIPIVSEGIKAVTGFTNSIFGGLDELITSDEERGKVRALIQEKSNQLTMFFEGEVTKRWISDNQADSVITKHIRPFLVGLVALVTMGVVIFQPENPNIKYLLTLAGTLITAYIGGRTMEKRK